MAPDLCWCIMNDVMGEGRHVCQKMLLWQEGGWSKFVPKKDDVIDIQPQKQRTTTFVGVNYFQDDHHFPPRLLTPAAHPCISPTPCLARLSS